MRTVTLCEVLEPRNDIVHPRDNPSGEGVFVGLEHIEPHTGRRIGSLPIRLEDLTGRKARFYRGDIVYGYLRPYLNKVWVADFDGYCSVDQYVLRATDSADADFVAAFLRSPIFLERAPIDESPGQLPRIRVDELLAVEAPLPQIDQQRASATWLARQLHCAMDMSDAGGVRLSTAIQLRRGAIEAALAGDWPSARLGDVTGIQLGKMLSPAAKLGRRPIRYLRNANVQWDHLDLGDVAEMDFTEREEAKFELRPGDVLACEGGEPGRAAVWRGEIDRCSYQKAIHRLRPVPNRVDPQFLVYRLWLGAMRGELSDGHAQTTIAHLPAVRLKELTIPLPPIAEQRRIAAELRERLATIDQMTRAIDAQLKAIEALPAALLRRAFEEIEAA